MTATAKKPKLSKARKARPAEFRGKPLARQQLIDDASQGRPIGRPLLR
jgi:hypothetical protein